MQKKNEYPEKTERKYPKYYYGIALLLPVIIILIAELLLRAAAYGTDIEQWVPVSEERDDLLVLNPDIAKKWFGGMETVPTSIYDPFTKEKAEDVFRVFILGESSAAGFPFSPNGGFSRYLEQRLRLMYPALKFEVINTGIAAINSYAIKDMLPGILEQKPDLILIYTGHNEWYGALGAASTDAAGGFFVDLRLLLSNLKVFQALEDLLQPAQDMPQDTGGGGLMKRMAAKNLVPYKSPLYIKGVEQYENNMDQILAAINEAGIPVIIGTLVSNLRDQLPFEPVRQEEYTSADTLFEQGSIAYADSNFSAALQLFQSARDYDALRFRAPGEFNTIIKRLTEEYDCVLVNVEEEFNTYSPGGIVGNNVMTDHLHPTLEGYQLLGALYYRALVNSGQLPDAAYSQYSDAEQDSIVKSRFPFSPLDSTVAAMRLAIILNNYPFTDSASTIPVEELITRSNAVDTLAFSVVTGQRSWYNAHLQAAEKYLANDNYSMFALEYRVITAQYWWQPELYRYAAEKLIDKKAYDDALVILEDYHRFQPDAFNAKWIGNIALFRNDYEKAAVYLFESAQHNNKDAQVYYNLSGAYIGLKEFTKAISALDNCLRIDSQYPGAAQLKEQLLRQPAQ